MVACGLDGVHAGCIADASTKTNVSVEGEIASLVERFGRAYERDMAKLDPQMEGEVGELIVELEEAARDLGAWSDAPSVDDR